MEQIRHSFHRQSASENPRGTALLLVLSSLALLSLLTVAFLLSARTDLQSAKAYASSTSVRQLADSTINLVQAQIKTATRGKDDANQDLAWASQPGMIRTFDRNGVLYRAYKLYSTANMTASSVNATDEAARLAGWKDRPAHLTDINEISAGVYPILDPAADGKVEGFSFATNLPTGVSPGEMPVEWLYVLKEGQIVAPASSTGPTTTAVIPGADKNNPVVGRIAFWVDDECSKVNINTASEGTFWDTPRVVTTADRNMGKFQPAKNEFQRYPGHPAMTSLRTAVPAISDAAAALSIAPRLRDGGSKQGTVSNVSSPVDLDRDRLYSGIDELIFDPNRNPQGITRQDLEISRFFITANSRAPEVNLFNTPRVAMWPVHENSAPSHRSAVDRLMAFCATLNGKPYFFQRSNPESPTNDFDAITRNKELFQYLQRLTALKVPGFGGGTEGFKTKYSNDRDQILTGMFDYIRCTNLNDQGVANPYAPTGQVAPIYISASDALGFGRFPTVQEAGIAVACIGHGKLTPAGGNATAASPVSPSQFPAYPGTDGSGTPPDNTEVVQAYLVISFMNPGMGYPTYSPSFTVQVEGLDNLKIRISGNDTTMGFPASGSTYVHWAGWPANSMFGHEPPAGGLDPRWFVIGKKFNTTSADDPQRFPFFSNPLVLPTTKLGYNGPSFTITGGEITVKVYSGNTTDTAALVQTIKMDIPGGSYPLPWKPQDTYRLIGTGASAGGYGDRFAKCDSGDANGTYRLFGTSSGAANDTVWTTALTSGDARTGFLRNVPKSLFSASPVNAGAPNVRSSFCANSGFSFFAGTKQGKLVKDTSSTLFANILPASLNGVYLDGDPAMPPGDFDNGIASMPDGPYINKPDEGDISGMAAGEVPYFKGWGQYSAVSTTYFSPNRQIPSSGMFGSLPSGIKAGKPWRTLLFRPDPTGKHPGGLGLPDHLFMDLFWMPVVEPYPISEPFSTAGKVNVNSQILPFSFINRETALRAVLKSERILAVPQTKVQNYKNLNNLQSAVLPDSDFRFDINLDETLSGLRQRFASNDVYRSASEICGIHLVPKDPAETKYADMSTFWNNYQLTGDNSRERPYTNIYPRITTKSNTYQIHFRVQTLQKMKADGQQDRWVEGKDKVLAEYRGSSVIERYIDPNDPLIPDYATDPNAAPIDNFYKFRVLSSRQIIP